MSLYNTLFGENSEYSILLGMIGLNKSYFERYRDIHLTNNGTTIRVMTRLGGGNRQYYEEIWNKIRKHELYLGDYDDGFDNTYAYIEYKIPQKFKDTAKKMFKSEPLPFAEMFKKELEDMNKEGTQAYKTAEKIAEKFVNAINNNDNDNNDDGNIRFIKL